jgi:hypothetical protein
MTNFFAHIWIVIQSTLDAGLPEYCPAVKTGEACLDTGYCCVFYRTAKSLPGVTGHGDYDALLCVLFLIAMAISFEKNVDGLRIEVYITGLIGMMSQMRHVNTDWYGYLTVLSHAFNANGDIFTRFGWVVFGLVILAILTKTGFGVVLKKRVAGRQLLMLFSAQTLLIFYAAHYSHKVRPGNIKNTMTMNFGITQVMLIFEYLILHAKTRNSSKSKLFVLFLLDYTVWGYWAYRFGFTIKKLVDRRAQVNGFEPGDYIGVEMLQEYASCVIFLVCILLLHANRFFSLLPASYRCGKSRKQAGLFITHLASLRLVSKHEMKGK